MKSIGVIGGKSLRPIFLGVVTLLFFVCNDVMGRILIWPVDNFPQQALAQCMVWRLALQIFTKQRDIRPLEVRKEVGETKRRTSLD